MKTALRSVPSAHGPAVHPARTRAQRTAVILNANAKRVTARVRRRVEAAANESTDVFFTESLEQAAFVMRRVADSGYGTVLTGGGDGTVSHTIDTILRRLDEAGIAATPRFGVLKLGTGNGVADFLGARDFRKDLRDVEQAGTRPLHLLDLENGARRTTFCGFGWDAFILDNYDRMKRQAQRYAITRALFKNVLGYLIAGVGKSVPELVWQRPSWNVRVVAAEDAAFRLDAEGQPVERFAPGSTIYEGPVRLGCFGTTPYYGFKFNMMPYAATAPGMLHMRLLNIHPLTAVAQLHKAWKGKLESPQLFDFHVRGAHLEFEKAAPFQISGDAAGQRQSFDVRIADRVLETLTFS